jgi:signal transduction histidine kinase/CheY-like chemotaxis protein/PAS domain-containing protein
MLRLVQQQRETADPRAILETAVRAVGEELDADRVGFVRMSHDDLLDFDEGVAWSNDRLPPLKGRLPMTVVGARYLAAMREGRTVGIADTAIDPIAEGGPYPATRTRAAVGAPILRAGRWIASLYVNQAVPRAWTPREIALVREVADLTWDAIERAEAVAELRGSEARFGAAIAVAQLGTFEWNVRTRSMALDRRSRELFGLEPDAEAAGASTTPTVDDVFARIHPADRGWVQAMTERAVRRGDRLDVEFRVRLPDGVARHVATSATMIPGEDGATEKAFGVFSDVTARRWDDVRNQVLVALNDRFADLDCLDCVDDLAAAAAEVLGAALGASHAGHGRVVLMGPPPPAEASAEIAPAPPVPDDTDPSGTPVRLVHDWAAVDTVPLPDAAPLWDDGGPIVEALARGELVVVADLARDRRTAVHAAALAAADVRSLVHLPLVEQGATTAVMYVAHRTPRAWSTQELLLIREVGERVRDVDERRRAEAALRESEARQAFLVRLTDALRAIGDPHEIQAAAARLLGERLAATRCWYSEYDEEAGGGVVLGDWAAPGHLSIAGLHRMADLESLHDRLREGAFVRVDDVEAPGPLARSDAARLATIGVRAIACLPLVKDGRLVAALAVGQAAPRHWSAADEAMVHDTAERTWAAVERAKAEAALRAADRRKDEFLATLAHELRNPLAPLRNGLQIARLTMRGDATLQRTVEMMDRQLTHLVRLVDDLLDVGRISSGKLALRKRPVALGDVLANAIESVRVLIEAHHHELVVRTDADDLRVLGDFDRLVQVFMNLLSNASKYTEPGGRLLLRVRREAGEAVVSVADTGIGIPPEDLPRVFELFSQVRSHQGRAEGGLGIGLSLVRSLVALHGGTVDAHSEGAGQGSVFTVRLPELAPTREDASTRRSTDRAERRSEPPRRVLVVDDNVDAAASLAALLELRGHRVRLAHDGVEALERAAEEMPEVLFLDLGMPRLGGIEAAKRLRAMPHGREVLLVALTGWGQDADLQRTREAGFDRHVVKPVDAATLAELMARPHRARAPAPVSPPTPAAGGTASPSSPSEGP